MLMKFKHLISIQVMGLGPHFGKGPSLVGLYIKVWCDLSLNSHTGTVHSECQGQLWTDCNELQAHLPPPHAHLHLGGSIIVHIPQF